MKGGCWALMAQPAGLHDADEREHTVSWVEILSEDGGYHMANGCM